MRLNKALIFRWGIGIALIAFLLSRIDYSELIQKLSGGHWTLILLAVLIVILDRIWMAAKWRILLTAQGLRVSVFECSRVYYIASFIGLVLPTSVGSDLVRLMSLSVQKGEKEKVAASIVVEKFLGMFALFFLVNLCLLLHIWRTSADWGKYFYMGAGFTLSIVILFILSLYYFPHQKLTRLEGKIFQILSKVIASYQQFKHHRKAMIVFFFVSLLEQMVPFVFTWVLVRAFNLPGSPAGYFVAVPVIYIVARIPISVDAIGVLEGISVVLYRSMVGLNITESMLLAFAGRFATTLGHLLGGMFYFVDRKKIKSIQEEE